jgi:hypothetical protein
MIRGAHRESGRKGYSIFSESDRAVSGLNQAATRAGSSRPFLRAIAMVALVVGLAANVVLAQEVPQPIVTIQLRFSNPGARSLGFGGALVALADDATAAWANSAGLVQIADPEVSVEFRYWSYSTPYVAGGRVRGEPTGIRLDTVDGVRTDTDKVDVTGLAFLSFVYPGERWSLSIYRHLFANLEMLGETEGLFTDDSDGETNRFLDQSNRTTLDMISYGLSGAYRISDDLSVGFGLVYYDSEIVIDSDLYLWDDLDDPFGSGTGFLPEHFVIGQTITGNDGSIRVGPGDLLGSARKPGGRRPGNR